MIASGLRLSGKSRETNRNERIEIRNAALEQAAPHRPRAQELELQSRAASVAAAASAMERRDIVRLASAQEAPRRLAVGQRGADRTEAARQPLGQTYRRNAQPRRAASSARRDR